MGKASQGMYDKVTWLLEVLVVWEVENGLSFNYGVELQYHNMLLALLSHEWTHYFPKKAWQFCQGPDTSTFSWNASTGFHATDLLGSPIWCLAAVPKVWTSRIVKFLHYPRRDWRRRRTGCKTSHETRYYSYGLEHLFENSSILVMWKLNDHDWSSTLIIEALRLQLKLYACNWISTLIVEALRL